GVSPPVLARCTGGLTSRRSPLPKDLPDPLAESGARPLASALRGSRIGPRRRKFGSSPARAWGSPDQPDAVSGCLHQALIAGRRPADRSHSALPRRPATPSAPVSLG